MIGVGKMLHVRRELSKCLNNAAAEAHTVARQRGQITKETTIEDFWQAISDEADEFAIADKTVEFDHEKVDLLSCDTEDYEKIFKDTKGDELADIIIVCLSTAQSLEIPIGDYVSAKLKYNSERDKA